MERSNWAILAGVVVSAVGVLVGCESEKWERAQNVVATQAAARGVARDVTGGEGRVVLATARGAVEARAVEKEGEKLVVDVWPEGKMPGTATTMPERAQMEASANAGARAGSGASVGGAGATSRAVSKMGQITNVSHPTLTVWAAPGEGKHPAVIICPGGAYSLLSGDLEGTEAAAWLNKIGVTGVILKYRVPGNREGAYMDMQRAMRMVRGHAGEWGIDAKRVGVMGFSAGGHLAARVSTGHETAAYGAVDEVDKVSCRPDFVMLIYPAYLEVRGAVAPEMKVSAAVPATFMVHAEDDARYVASSKVYYAALQGAKADAELHLFADGGHGFGLRSTKSVSVWPGLAETWLKKEGVVK